MFSCKSVSAGMIYGIPVAVVLMVSACDTRTSSREQSDTDIQQSARSNDVTDEASESDARELAPTLAGPPVIVRATFPDSAGKTYFNEQVLAKLAENGCPICHMPGAGYVRPEISYDGLFPFLAMGQAADNNVLMFKIANQRSFAPDQPNHPGGKRCETEDSDPCKTVKAWWEVEFGSDSD